MTTRALEIIEKGGIGYGHLDGFLYSKSYPKGDVTYWKCRHRSSCAARLTTISMGRSVMIRKGGAASSHNHEPNPEDVEALRIMSKVKRAARNHPERPPPAVLREAQTTNAAVQAQLPELHNIRKIIQRERLKHLPSNPANIQELTDIPDEFTKTLVGEKFLMYDSNDDEDYSPNFGRILIFATHENLRLLFKSDIWFLDGTFDTVPSIFFQLFTIMGSVVQKYKGTNRKIAMPFVYALLEDKKEVSYTKVLQIVLSLAEGFGIPVREPDTAMTDFEMAIINALKKTFSEANIRLCLFHLSQSVYRKIQAEGLQQKYGDPNDSSIRQAAHTMCALAFVPPEDVPDVFDVFHNEMPQDFIPIATYFEVNYVRGIRAVGRRKAVKVRYDPTLWNHYHSVLQGIARTNNASEGWHNRFQLLVGRRHPSIFSFIAELQKEQADVEYMLRDLSLGKRIKKLPQNKLLEYEERIHVDEGTEFQYVTNIGYHFHI